jgi:hypothetical protein
LALLLLVNTRTLIATGRTVVLLMPLILPVVAYGLMQLPTTARGFLGGLVLVLSLVAPIDQQPRLPLHEFAQRVAAQVSAGDLIVLEFSMDDLALEYELRQALGPRADTVTFIRSFDWTSPQYRAVSFDDAMRLAQTYPRVIILNWLTDLNTNTALTAAQYRRAEGSYLSVKTENPIFTDAWLEAWTLLRAPTAPPLATFGGDQPQALQLQVATAAYQPVATVGAPLQVDVWWRGVGMADRDYSLGVMLQREDGTSFGPVVITPPMTQYGADWQGVWRYTLDLPADLPAGDYRLIVNAYWWDGPQPLVTQLDGQPYAVIGTINLKR